MSSKQKKLQKGIKLMEDITNEEQKIESSENKEPRIVSGVVVDSSSHGVGVEADPEVRAVIQSTRTDQKLAKKDSRTSFEAYTDGILENGTDGEKNIITNMRIYLDRMKSGASLSVDDLVRTQQMFYTTIRFAFKQEDSFNACMRLLVQYFYYYGSDESKILGERYVFRGIQHFTLSKPHLHAFQHTAGLLQRLARMENPSRLLNQVDIDKELNNTFNDDERQRFVSFIETP